MIEKEAVDVNQKFIQNDGKLMICEVSGMYYFSWYLLYGTMWKPKRV